MKKVILFLCVLTVLGFSGCFSFRYSTDAPIYEDEEIVDIDYPELDTIEAYVQMKEMLAENYIKKSGMPNGVFRLFFRDGSTRVEGRIVDKQLHNVFRIYHENGTPYLIANYANGVLQHSLTTYYEDGTKQMYIVYKKGVLNGDFHLYYPDGTMHIRRFYKNGLPASLAIVYNENGTEQRRIKYDD